ncbi:hypothetical protein N7532_003635 [Penicillium argentinense]|uniref:Uncharacterized protein n=1 Tax=Penicillium argentinense TaxID=1131581 RepID=A0A9W9FMT5_9EURO|nr:uncharacterized protein N7532_003635 [Penicillium argentinense]KAJ5103106.1 hypothetical protein N7532_003635 [Penicillium argentinense]
MVQVALIVGGTSGIGFSVAEAIAQRGWQINIVGMREEKGQKAASALANAKFHKANVSDYDELARVFHAVFNSFKRLDFVFANAGIPEFVDLFAPRNDDEIPPKPGLDLLDINLNGALYTSYLAVHYFRRSPEHTRGNRNLIITSSIGGLYPCMLSPVYSGSKHALIGFVRSIGDRLFKEGIRVTTICPGVVKTPLLNEELLSYFPEDVLIPIEAVTDVTMKTLAGGDLIDSKGNQVPADKFHSQVLHITGQGFYFIDQPPIHDQEARSTWNAMMGWR